MASLCAVENRCRKHQRLTKNHTTTPERLSGAFSFSVWHHSTAPGPMSECIQTFHDFTCMQQIHATQTSVQDWQAPGLACTSRIFSKYKGCIACCFFDHQAVPAAPHKQPAFTDFLMHSLRTMVGHQQDSIWRIFPSNKWSFQTLGILELVLTVVSPAQAGVFAKFLPVPFSLKYKK